MRGRISVIVAASLLVVVGLLSRGVSADDGVIKHVVKPHETDPALDEVPEIQYHYAWLDPDARPKRKLLVFLPGTGTPPSACQLLQREAAQLGYHVVGLMYQNTVALATICPSAANPDACFENARLEILDGVDRTSDDRIKVDAANSIENRLTKLLQRLVELFPDEGWSHFLTHDGEPKWSHIAVSGHSQGGGEAAMIAKLRKVDRVVLLSSVPDNVPGFGAPTWEVTHATASERYWGLAHSHDSAFNPIRASWTALGMDAFGPAVIPEIIEVPYNFTHMLVTGLMPRGGLVNRNDHNSTAIDIFTPLAADGTPLLRDAWRYLLTAHSADDDDVDDSDEDDGENSSRTFMPDAEQRH